MNKILEDIQARIDNYHEKYGSNATVGELSDGDHSFNDLYEHRTILLAMAMFHFPYAWKSRVHEDGTMYDGMFIAGFPTPEGMVTYHCNLEYWNYFKVPELPHAPHFDGYTDRNCLNRMKNLLENSDRSLFSVDLSTQTSSIVEKYINPVFDNCENPYLEKIKFLGYYIE